MTASETAAPLAPPFRSYRLHNWPGQVMECRPISDAPTEQTVSIMYRLTGNSLRQCGVGSFTDGVWTNGAGKALDVDGLVWTRIVPENG
jgi:hypothetical protein